MNLLEPSRAQLALLVAAYAGALLLGHAFSFESEQIATFWPATGLLLGVLLVTRPQVWWRILALSMATQLGVEGQLSDTEFVSYYGVMLNAAEPLLAAWLLRPILLEHSGALSQLGRALATAVGVTALIALCGAVIAAKNLTISSYLWAWQVWWFSDLLSLLVVTPWVLAWLYPQADPRAGAGAWQERTVWLAGVVVTAVFVYSLPAARDVSQSLLDAPYLIFPFLIWSALRFSARTWTGLVLGVGLVAVAATGAGYGPFVDDTGVGDVLSLQVYLATLAVSGLVIAALSSAELTSRQRLRAFFDHAPDGLAIRDVDGTYLELNEAASVEHRGGSTEQSSPQSDEVTDRADAQVLENGRSLIIELNGKDGRAFQQLRFPITDTSGRIAAIGSISTEVTELTRLRDQLLAAENDYRAFLIQSQDAIFRLRMDPPMWIGLPLEKQVDYITEHAVIDECNEVAALRHGFRNRAEMIGQPLAASISRSNRGWQDYLRHFIESGYRTHLVEDEIVSNGAETRAHLTSWFAQVERGHLATAWGIQIDITEQRKLKDAVAEHDRVLRQALESAGSGGYEVDLVSGEVHCSERVLATFGMTTDDWEPRLNFILDLVHPDDFSRFNAVVLEHLQGATPYFVCQLRARHASGVWFWVEIRGSVVQRDTAGRALRLVAIVTDITELRHNQELLSDYRDRLRALAAEVSLTEERTRRKLAGELHDGPLQELALARMQISAALHGREPDLHALQTLLESAINQARTLMFELSPPILYELGLAPALEWLAESHQARSAQPCTFHTRGEELRLPDALAVTLYQIARELLINVTKHADASRAALGLHWQADTLTLTVEDDGHGMPARTGQADPADSGFGLFSVRNRVELMEGHMEVHTGPATGTRIHVTVTVPEATPARA